MSGELPAYFLREKDLEPDIGLRPLLAAGYGRCWPPQPPTPLRRCVG
jgi:hypothetical protein